MAVTYLINEIFYSIQGEGVRAGEPSVFIRFSKCNLTCKVETHGFDCDTEFESGRRMGLLELIDTAQEVGGKCRSVILTGGEPALQIDPTLISELDDAGFYICIETNGTKELPKGIDWITVSPKTAEHTLRVRRADEVKYVRAVGQGIPKPVITSPYYLLSPAWENDGFGKNLEWCIDLVKENPTWRLSMQQHKFWDVR